MERTSSTAPAATASKSACWDSLRTWSSSPAPAAREISTIMAVPMAPGMLLTSQVTVVVVLTAAVACSPSWPTMAVSTYCKRVESTCSTMVGMDKNTSVRNSAAVAGGNRAERLVIRGQLPCNGFSAVLRGSQLQVYGSAGQKANTCLPWQGIANCYGRQKALPGGRAQTISQSRSAASSRKCRVHASALRRAAQVRLASLRRSQNTLKRPYPLGLSCSNSSVRR